MKVKDFFNMMSDDTFAMSNLHIVINEKQHWNFDVCGDWTEFDQLKSGTLPGFETALNSEILFFDIFPSQSNDLIHLEFTCKVSA